MRNYPTVDFECHLTKNPFNICSSLDDDNESLSYSLSRRTAPREISVLENAP